MKKLIKINGLHCLECKMKVEDELNAMIGVVAEVDLDSGIATVTYTNNVSEKEILKTISSSGYDGVVL